MSRIRNPAARDRVVEAARRTVAEHGVKGATMRAIASAAGVTTGQVTHYFDGKHQLLQAALERNNAVAAERVLAASRSGAGLDGLAAAIETLLPLTPETQLEWQVWVAFWVSVQSDEEAVSPLEVAFQALAALLTPRFTEAVAAGELPAEVDPAYELDRLIVLTAGLGLMAGARPDDAMGAVARRMLADHLAGLRASATAAS